MTLPKKYDVLIVEDEAIIAETLKAMLKSIGHRCVGILNSFVDAQKAIESENYDLAILDINLEGDHEGIKLGALCSQKNKPFLFLTSYSDTETILIAKDVKPGAYLIKPFTQQELLANIEISMIKHSDEEMTHFDLKGIINQLSLSYREAEVLTCLCKKLSNAQISEELNVSTNTVKFHLKNIYFKLNINGRTDLDSRLHALFSPSKANL